MKITMLPLLFAIQVFAISFAARRTMAAGYITKTGASWIYGLLTVLTIWGATSAMLTLSGTYHDPQFLNISGPLWVPFVPVVLVMIPLMLFRQAREVVNRLIDHTPLYWLIAMHGLRILAIGSILKAWNGEFSASFAAYVALPDFLFGLSAPIMAWLAFKDRVGTWTVVLWNIIGLLIIVPNTMVIIQLGLPGPWQIFSTAPTIMTLYEFPMALAPTLVVPVFVMMNMFVSVRLASRWIEMRTATT